jgi:sortase A
VILAVAAALLAAAIWMAWTWWGSTLLAANRGRDAASSAQQAWSASPSAPANSRAAGVSGPADGQLIAVIRIPKLGADWRWPVYASTDDPTNALDHGLAWYRGSALPGQIGNFAVAGRSATGANAFRNADRLAKGDEVIVETPSAVCTYRIDVPFSGLTVRSSDAWVLDPVPGHPDAAAQQPLITLTTSRDAAPTDARSVALGHLVRTASR